MEPQGRRVEGSDSLYDEIRRIIDDMIKGNDKTAARNGKKDIEDLLDMKSITNKMMIDNFRRKTEQQNDSVLLYAVSRFRFREGYVGNQELEVINLLLNKLPMEVITAARTSENFRGLNVLHCLIARRQKDLILQFLRKLEKQGNKNWKRVMLEQITHSSTVGKTVMIGELPLSVAALTLEKDMFQNLLEVDANLEGQNSKGDTVCHSLIRYGEIFPDKIPGILEIFALITEASNKGGYSSENMPSRKAKRRNVWLMTNKQERNPLQLAAELGQSELFDYIIQLEHYRYIDLEKGVFDIYTYDITEIDTIHPKLSWSDDSNRDNPVTDDGKKQKHVGKEDKPEPILQMLLKLDGNTAKKFLPINPLTPVIELKWAKCKWVLLAWGILHVAFMIGLSYYAYERSLVTNNHTLTFVRRFGDDAFVTAYGSISLVVSLVYLRFFISLSVSLIVQYCRRSYHCGSKYFWNSVSQYSIAYFIFALSLFIDFIWFAVGLNLTYNYFLTVSIISGWLLFLFFIRTIRRLSFFTALIERLLFGDLLRYAVVMTPILVAFSLAIFMAMQGSSYTDDDTFDSYIQTLVLMLRVMVGLGDFEVIFAARHPVAVLIIFVAFVLLTTILLLNALIAMMSNTCTELLKDETTLRMHWRLQKLYVILFLEEMSFGLFRWGVGHKQERCLRFCPTTLIMSKLLRSKLHLSEYDYSKVSDTIEKSWPSLNTAKGKKKSDNVVSPEESISKVEHLCIKSLPASTNDDSDRARRPDDEVRNLDCIDFMTEQGGT